MFRLLLFSLLSYSTLGELRSSTPHWDYQRHGPDAWPHVFDACEGDAQSPVDIHTSHVKYDSHLAPLLMNSYTTSNTISVWNFTHNGHTIIAYPSPLSRLSISGASLLEVYYLVNVHFHWGYHPYHGSEHTIDSTKFPLEVHFVHEARSPNTYAVLSVLFTLQRHDNEQLNDLLSIVNQTINASVWNEYRFDVSRLFPTTSTKHFFLYNGSFTVPPCTEGITWIVLAKHVPISVDQLEVFSGNSVPSNFRSPQKLSSRTILADFEPEPYEGESSHGTPHSTANHARISIFSLSIIIVSFSTNY
ncbi:unnamed protein product [Adineta ricciae]|uniref:Carbonic anhydrase n=1 Tax=Adineta ricciae TaxID=249248 RepID=A0A815VXT1_ADIRI|nr:unnamed protein product [Adineta ricciae]